MDLFFSIAGGLLVAFPIAAGISLLFLFPAGCLIAGFSILTYQWMQIFKEPTLPVLEKKCRTADTDNEPFQAMSA